MNKLTFTLKQHTPLIHFQPDQDGATLRASEVKPRLDRFIIEKLGGIAELRKIHPNWLIGKDDQFALNYKLKIIADNSVNLLLDVKESTLKDRNTNELVHLFKTDNFPMFLSNMGGKQSKDELKNFSFFKNVKFDLFLTSNSLKDEIENSIAGFLLVTNFGNRQSKGFGSFYLYPEDKFYKVPFSKYYFNLEYDQNISNRQKYNRLFNDLDLFYRTLRGGINQKLRHKDASIGFINELKRQNRYHRGADNNDYEEILYFKSLLFLYAKNNADSQWEKKTIKETFYLKSQPKVYGKSYMTDLQQEERIQNKADKNSPLFYENKKKFIFKDLLGLSTEESWYSYDDVITKGEAKLNKHGDYERVPEKEQTISRYTSPLFIKPIEYGSSFQIFIVNKESSHAEERLQGNHFEISNKTGKPLIQQVYPDFSLESYLRFVFSPNNWNINTHVEIKFQESKQFLTLKKIFNEIQRNYIL
ncbi:MAG: hypothetical protein WCP85_07430 [Mariniphaga sp.]